MITDNELIKIAIASGFEGKQIDAIFYDSGPYDITKPTLALLNFVRAIAKLQREKDAGICSKRAESLRAHNDKSLEGMINTADGLADAILAQGDE